MSMAASFLDSVTSRANDIAAASRRIQLEDLPLELLRSCLSHADPKGMCSGRRCEQSLAQHASGRRSICVR